MVNELNVNIDEQLTEEECYERFVKTIGQTVDSYNREKYGAQIVYEVVKVACSNVEDLFADESIGMHDCVRTSAYIPYIAEIELPVMRDSEAYEALVQKVQSSYEKYQGKVIGQSTLYHSINGACTLVDQILEANAKKQGYSLKK